MTQTLLKIRVLSSACQSVARPCQKFRLVEALIEFLAEGRGVELFLDGAMEALADPIGLRQLQADLDDWLREYNLTRTHSGKYCYGKTPMQTFLDSAHLAQEKMLDSFQNVAPKPERSHAQRSVGGGAAADAAA